ncbi:NADH dehydrogenase [ubiquinone] 1 alpha subcomplex assembly factor 4 [Arctopsyche grandis]|uniref:NADH dehydrogenase [ubiquinone] 1 alpha subcomplex assembly factor 4 n=1 Tax=Arctopsyche grandis TaxID=121162 RepID=UPI00406D99B1
MGKVWSSVMRPIKTFNIENRAHRVISRDKPELAPKYKVDKESLDKLLKENPDIIESYSKKHTILDNRLKTVYVSSTDPEANPEMSKSKRTLPLDRKSFQESDFSTWDPEFVPPGRLMLRDIFQVLALHVNEGHSSESLAAQWGVKKEVLDELFKYYGTFEIHIPKGKEKSFELTKDPVYIQHMASKKYIDEK